MKRLINILIFILSVIVTIPMLAPLTISGVAWCLGWIAEKITKVLTYPVVLMEWLITKINN